MPLPPFDTEGDMPGGVYPAAIGEVITRFGTGTTRRAEVAGRLTRIHDLAGRTGGLDRMIVFGSFVTAKPDPRDVDVLLVMRDDFDPNGCPPECDALFDHRRADDELGASVFWVRPAMVFGEPLDDFVAGWGQKREGGRRALWRYTMIQNDTELAVTQERIAYFLDLLRRIRRTARPDEFPLVAGGYRAEVERMQQEMLDYLTAPVAAKAG